MLHSKLTDILIIILLFSFMAYSQQDTTTNKIILEETIIDSVIVNEKTFDDSAIVDVDQAEDSSFIKAPSEENIRILFQLKVI